MNDSMKYEAPTAEILVLSAGDPFDPSDEVDEDDGGTTLPELPIF